MTESVLLPAKDLIEQERELDLFSRLFSRGKTRIEICEYIGIDPGSPRFEILQDRFYERAETQIKSKSPYKLFSEYIEKQSVIIQDLEGMKRSYEVAPGAKSEGKGRGYSQGQAYVAACKTQSDILDKIIKTGQDLGIIVKTPEKIELVNGRDPRDMSQDELTKELESHMAELSILTQKAGIKSTNTSKILAFSPDGSRK